VPLTFNVVKVRFSRPRQAAMGTKRKSAAARCSIWFGRTTAVPPAPALVLGAQRAIRSAIQAFSASMLLVNPPQRIRLTPKT